MLKGLNHFTVILRGSSPFRRYSSSVVSVAGPELINKTYFKIIEEQSKLYPHKDLFRSVPDDHLWTFKDTQKAQDAIANGILESGSKGTVTTSLPLRIENIILQIAAVRSNTPFVVIDPSSQARKLEVLLKKADPRTFVWSPKVKSSVVIDELYQVLPRLNEVDRSVPINDRRFPSLKLIFQTSKQDFDGLYKFADFPSWASSRPLQRIESTIDPKKSLTSIFNDDLQEIVLTQYGILNTGYLVGVNAGLNEADVVCSTLTLEKGYGLSLNVGLALSHKVKLVWGSEIFDAQAVFDAVQSQYATVLIAHPDEVEAILPLVSPNSIKNSQLNKVILVSYPGNLVSADLIERVKSVLGVKDVFVSFGIPETCGVISITSSNPSFENSFVVGQPLAHTEVKIVDKNGATVPLGTTGELAVKGFNVTQGYKGESQLNSEKIKNGFLHTGIRAQLDTNKNVVVNSN